MVNIIKRGGTLKEGSKGPAREINQKPNVSPLTLDLGNLKKTSFPKLPAQFFPFFYNFCLLPLLQEAKRGTDFAQQKNMVAEAALTFCWIQVSHQLDHFAIQFRQCGCLYQSLLWQHFGQCVLVCQFFNSLPKRPKKMVNIIKRKSLKLSQLLSHMFTIPTRSKYFYCRV